MTGPDRAADTSPAPTSTSEPTLRGVELAALTANKTVANTALRWLGPFLPVLERAFGTTIGALTAVLAVVELGGLSTIATGRMLDRGRRRRTFLVGSGAVALSSVIALGGSLTWFALAAAVLVVGVANLTIAGLAWISAIVPYERRGRAIGTFELSWALALCIGGPIIAVLVEVFGWRGPFAALAIAATITTLAVAVLTTPEPSVPRNAPRSERPPRGALPGSAWPPLVASACVAAAGLGVFVISGAWLSDRHGVPTAGIGAVVVAFGIVELVASGSSAAFADRIGKRRSMGLGVIILLAGLAVTAASGSSLLLAIVGLTVFLAGFEFAFVTSLSVMSEAAPEARGQALGVGNALGTLARAGSVFASGQLYERVGMGAALALSCVTATVALALVALTRR